MYLNHAIVVGNLTRDPELKALPSGITVTSFSVATNRTWKDKSGAKQESSDFHNIVVFGNQADACAKYLKKGQSVLVEGRMQTRSWDKPDGSKAYRTEIVAGNIQFGSRQTPKTSATDAESEKTIDITPEAETTPKTAKTNASMGEQIEYPTDDINPEDIPF